MRNNIRRRKSVSDTVDEHDREIRDMKVFLFGDKDNVGVAERLRDIQDVLGTLKRLAWIVVGCAITITISGVSAAVVYLIREMGR